MDPRLQFKVRADYDSRWKEQVVNDARSVSQGVKTAGGEMGAAMKGAGDQTGNLVAQLNDIGTTLAGGGSPMLIALQQGTQISQVLGPMGAAGAAKSLGAAFLSLLSPVNVLTIGTIALGGAAVQWLMGLSRESPAAEDRLKAHRDWLASIVEGYDGAKDAAEAYLNEATKLPQTAAASELNTKLVQLTDDYNDALKDLKTTRDSYLEDKTRIFWETPDAIAQADALGKVQEQLSLTNPDLDAMIDNLTLIKNSAVNDKLRSIAEDLLANAQNAKLAHGEIRSVAAALGELYKVPASFTEGIDALKGLGVKPPTDRERAISARDKALGDDPDIGTRIAVMKEYNNAIARIDTREAEEEALKRSREAVALGNKQVKAYEGVIASLEAERELVGKSALEQEQLNAIRAAGVDIGTAEADAIREKVKALIDAQDAQEIIDSLKSPVAATEEYMARLKELLEAGALDWDQYAAAVRKANDDIAVSTGDSFKKSMGEFASFASDLSGVLGQIFEGNKTAAIAGAVLDTAAGVAKTLGSYQYPLNIVMAGLHMAAGIAQINKIKSTTKTSTSVDGAPAGSGTVPAAAAGGGGIGQGLSITLVGDTVPTARVADMLKQLQDYLGVQGKALSIVHKNG